MRKLSLIFFILLTHIPSFAQEKIPSFGKIDLADLLLKSCSFEPSAPAMKLFDVQETEFDIYPSGYDVETRIKTERRVRIKIFNERGYKYATIKVPYLSKRGVGKIKELGAYVYNLDASGKVITTKLDKDDFFKIKAADNIGIVNFTFPNLRPGSVIEFRYTKIERNIVRLDPWLIQDEIPVAYTSNTIITPSESKLIDKPYGTDSVESEVSFRGVNNIFEKKVLHKENVPSFKPESFMSSFKDNLQRVAFILIPSNGFTSIIMSNPDAAWKFFGAALLGSSIYKDQLEKTIPGTEGIIDSAKNISVKEDRINFIYQAVKKRIPYKTEQSLNFGDIIDAWTNKEANSSEINLILLNLLQKSGVLSMGLLVSTRDNGRINKDFPSAGQFNGMDVAASDSTKLYLLDASLKFQSIQNPPLNILNREAFLLKKDAMQWVAITDERSLLKQITNISAELNEDGFIEGASTSQYFDYAKSYRLDSTLDENKNGSDGKAFSKKTPGLKIVSVKRENEETDGLPLIELTEFKYEPQQTGNYYFINPLFLAEEKETPFTSDKRNTDIDLGCKQQIVVSLLINFPPSCEVDFLPKNIIVRAPDSSFFYKRTFDKDSDHVLMMQVFEVKRPLFSRDEYEGVQDFFKRMYTLMAEEIVLKRKKK